MSLEVAGYQWAMLASTWTGVPDVRLCYIRSAAPELRMTNLSIALRV